MKKLRNLILSLAMASTLNAAGQVHGDYGTADTVKYHRTGYIIVGSGAGIPTGNFHATALNIGLLSNSIKSGFANTGFTGFTEFAIPVSHSNFGFAARTAYYSNPVNGGALTAANDHFTGTRGYFTVSATPYITNTLLCGLYVTLPAGKLAFDFKALGGMALCGYPAITLALIYGPPSTKTVTTPATTSFAYGGNFTARYSIKAHFCAFAQCGLVAAKQDYSMIETVFNFRSGPTTAAKPNTEAILNTSVGLGYQF